MRAGGAALLALLLAAPGLALPLAEVPAPAVTDAPFGMDLAGLPEPVAPAQRVVPRDPGTVVRMPLLYGPFGIPAGWDLNRLHLDVPLHDGFLTKLSYRLVDAATGEAYNNMQVHIHHALWFEHPEDGLIDFGSLVWGTGEEVTAMDLDARSDAVPGGPRYGLFLGQGQAQSMLMMLHNKEQAHRVVNLLLDVTFVSGTAAQIAAAADCGPLPLPSEGCRAGEDFHALDGRLWGATYNVPRQANGPGTHQYPSNGNPKANSFVAQASGTLIHAQGHQHQNGIVDVIVNLGPDGAPCGDLDQDGFPGITLLRSDKIDRNPLAAPVSEDFQMGVTAPGFRAPIRQGDRIAQFGLYANRDYASYQAMAFAASHVDEAAPPAPRGGGCTLANTAPSLIGGGDATRSVPNHAWAGDPLALCGIAGAPPCNGPAPPVAGTGLEADTVVIAGFTYVPGDQHLFGAAGAPPRVRQGQSLTFVNGDESQVIRHTVTSCTWPCNGHHAANYPQPDAVFESDRIGNLDILDGGGPNDAVPTWTSPASLGVGLYSYYCRLHPFMRGWYEVVP